MALTKIGKEGITGISNSSDANAITIDSSENVGIGTSSLDNKVNIQESSLSGRSSSNGNTSLTLEHATDTGIQFFSATQTQLRFGDADSTGAGSIIYEHSTDKLRLNTGSLLTFEDGGTERMRIDANGLLKSTPTYNNNTGSSANMVVFSDGQFARSTSSLRYKNTINDATHGLTELLTLRPVTYKGNNDGDTVFGGLIAEEVHTAGLTEFVTYNDDGEPDALAYGNMVSLCIKAIQELSAKVTTLETAKTDLEARITALESA